MCSESSSDSVWNYIVFSGSGCFAESQVNLFLNGSSTSSIYSTSGTPSLLSDDQNRTLRIGRRNTSDDYPYYHKGLIDDVRIYDRALSAVEVKALYELGEQPVQESGSGTTTVVNGTVADGSITASKIADQTITTNQLSEQILKYLKPEITQQPTTAGGIFADTNGTISVSAEGKYLSYQWKKNGVNLAGETNATLSITDANATQHDGNYSVVVSNDFGSVESGDLELLISNWNPSAFDDLLLWLDANDNTSIVHDSNLVSVWKDKSGNSHDATQSNDSKKPEFVLNGDSLGALQFDGTDILELSNESPFDLSNFSIFAVSSGDGTIFSKNTANVSQTDPTRRNLHLKRSHFADGGDYGYVTLNNSFSASDLAIICFTSSGTTVHEYSINGNLEASSTLLNTNSFNDATPSIGSAFESGAETLTGFICEIILFSSASSTSEMKNDRRLLSSQMEPCR